MPLPRQRLRWKGSAPLVGHRQRQHLLPQQQQLTHRQQRLLLQQQLRIRPQQRLLRQQRQLILRQQHQQLLTHPQLRQPELLALRRGLLRHRDRDRHHRLGRKPDFTVISGPPAPRLRRDKSVIYCSRGR